MVASDVSRDSNLDPNRDNPLVHVVRDQHIHVLPAYTLECGATLTRVPIAYKTWGTLNERGDNVVVICHALTGSADAADWWGPLLGPGAVVDTDRFFVFCANITGSPYGSASPLTLDPATGQRYGPAFPLTTIRDDVHMHRAVLDALGARVVQFVIGGSLGGMQALEWASRFGPDYVRHVVPLATSARHSAWGISWGEAQRQSIYADPRYCDGHYALDAPPATGLAAARMTALLTYRSRASFDTRFGRRTMPALPYTALAPHHVPRSDRDAARLLHNEGHRVRLHPDGRRPPSVAAAASSPPSAATANAGPASTTLPASAPSLPAPTAVSAASSLALPLASPFAKPSATPSVYSVQSYLRYQGDKFLSRFDANCYIAITRKMDTHDVSRGYAAPAGVADDATDAGRDRVLAEVLATRLVQPALVIGIETDGLFAPEEQAVLADGMPNARLVVIPSAEGHDGFLLEFEQIGAHIGAFIDQYTPAHLQLASAEATDGPRSRKVGAVTASTFGEADDLLQW
ncbi:hypothetical protein CXG81DRAFT_12864 [Caulochytrium protostelioides]|uniref:AB hydrolase-1 domain-containing protein n=1 Tax=Caulochytrium protostelioides TaxID=1555241 RepID=A0A4P9X6D3_9FUNG|nr:hypothetical protein CXG81DRAFT_12864 [Caulochytrium protostelioides]|eukprot:RKP00733.1 hypothetical protein CXG81DRAFT_12864 [Caulochytrium protostelioides]